MFDRGPGSSGLDPQAFRSLADFLDRATGDQGRRAGTRAAALDRARRVRIELPDVWRSPASERTTLDLGTVLQAAVEPDERLGAAIRALAGLAREARRVAAVLEEVEHYEKTWNEQFVANWSEWQDRTTTAIAGWFGGDEEEKRSEALTAAYQEQTWRTEEASRRRSEALAQWHARCREVAGAMGAATDSLNRAYAATVPVADQPPGPPDPVAVRAVQVVNDLRTLFDAPGPPLWEAVPGAPSPGAERAAALIGGLSPAELEAVLALLAPEEQVRLLSTLPKGPRRHVATVAGRLQAASVRSALTGAGIDPDRFDPRALRFVAPTSAEYDHLVTTLDAAGQLLVNEDAATAYFQGLGLGGTRAVLGAVDAGLADLAHREVAEAGRDPLNDVLSLHISGFALTTDRSELAELRSGLLDVDREWQRHQLGLLLGGNGRTYDPAFLVRATEVVVDNSHLALPAPLSAPLPTGRGPEAPVDEATRRAQEDAAYPGARRWHTLYRDGDLANPEVAALRGLSQNEKAAFAFVTTDDGQPDKARIELLVKPFAGTRLRELSFAHGEDVSTFSPWSQDLRSRAERYGAGVLSAVLTGDEAAMGTTHDRLVGVYDVVIDQVGAGGATLDAKRAATGALHVYIDDVITTISDQEQALDGSQRGRFDRPDMVRFFKEIAGDEESVTKVGETLGVYTQVVATTIMSNPPSEYELHSGKLHNTARLMGALADGFGLSSADGTQSGSALAFGLQTAFAAGIEVALLYLPSGAAPVAEVVKSYGGKLIEKQVDGSVPKAPMTAEAVRSDLTNKLENWIYEHRVIPNVVHASSDVEEEVAKYMRENLHLPGVFTREFDYACQGAMKARSEKLDVERMHWNAHEESS